LGLVAGFVLGSIPIINKYKLPIQIISLLLFAVGLWYEGGIAKDAEWKARVLEMEKAVAEAQVKSEQTNAAIVAQVAEEKRVAQENVKTVIRYVERQVSKYDKTCVIPAEAIIALNAASKNNTESLGEK
jgi:hypothetical protein